MAWARNWQPPLKMGGASGTPSTSAGWPVRTLDAHQDYPLPLIVVVDAGRAWALFFLLMTWFSSTYFPGYNKMLLVLVASTCITPGAIWRRATWWRCSFLSSAFEPSSTEEMVKVRVTVSPSSSFDPFCWNNIVIMLIHLNLDKDCGWVRLLPIVHLNWSHAFQKAQIPHCLVEIGSFLANKTRHFQGYPCCPTGMSPDSARLYNQCELTSLVCRLWATSQAPSQKYPHFLMCELFSKLKY